MQLSYCKKIHNVQNTYTLSMKISDLQHFETSGGHYFWVHFDYSNGHYSDIAFSDNSTVLVTIFQTNLAIYFHSDTP